MTLRYEKLTGPALKAVIPDLAALRIAVFRDWPYLYEGSREYEETYLARYAENPRAIVIGAYDGVRLVGASTATPLASEIEEFRAPFEKHGYDVSRVFYFGESILLPDYRGQGAGHVFFDEREAQARAAGGIAYTAFCAVRRAGDDPRKPSDYRPLDAFWNARGYRPGAGHGSAVFLARDRRGARKREADAVLGARALARPARRRGNGRADVAGQAHLASRNSPSFLEMLSKASTRSLVESDL